MPLILTAESYPPLYLSGPLMHNKLDYYEALTAVQVQDDWPAWVDMVSRSVTEATEEALAIAKDLQELVGEWKHLVERHRSDSVASRLPPLLIDHPVVSAKQVAALLSVSIRAGLDRHRPSCGVRDPHS